MDGSGSRQGRRRYGEVYGEDAADRLLAALSGPGADLGRYGNARLTQEEIVEVAIHRLQDAGFPCAIDAANVAKGVFAEGAAAAGGGKDA